MDTTALILQLLEEEYNQVHGTLLFYEHQLSLEEKFRRIPPEDIDENNLKNLRLYRAELVTAINEVKPKSKT